MTEEEVKARIRPILLELPLDLTYFAPGDLRRLLDETVDKLYVATREGTE